MSTLYPDFGRPRAFDDSAAIKFLEIYHLVNFELLRYKRCNQYDVAIELKRLFGELKSKTQLTQKRVALCEKFSIHYYLESDQSIRQFSEDYDIPYSRLANSPSFWSTDLHQLEEYILWASPIAIVQMKKRLKRIYEYS